MDAAFVATGTFDDLAHVQASEDGITWDFTDLPSSVLDPGDVLYVPELGFWMFMASNSTDRRRFTSTDGFTWTDDNAFVGETFTAVGGLWNGRIAWSAELSLFVLVIYGSGWGHSLWTSPDGITWTFHTNPLEGAGADCLVFGVVWAAELGLFMIAGAPGSLGTTQVATSPDGSTWTTHNLDFAPNFSIECACWSPDLPMFVIGDGGSGNVWTSPNGTAWTRRSTPLRFIVEDVCWSPDVGRFVAVGGNPASGAQGGIATSEDGITWTQRMSAFFPATLTPPGAGFYTPYAVEWNSELGLFCIVGDRGAIQTSPDGITWTEQQGQDISSDLLFYLGTRDDGQGFLLGAVPFN